jgi:hypothetical protein
MNAAASLDGVGDRIVPRHHIRTMRMQRHLVVAGFASVTYALILPSVNDFLGLMILAIFVSVVLGSLARAADALLGYGWGWLYGEPEYSTWLDLLVDGILRHLISVPISHSSDVDSAIDTADDESRIRILPLAPEHH